MKRCWISDKIFRFLIIKNQFAKYCFIANVLKMQHCFIKHLISFSISFSKPPEKPLPYIEHMRQKHEQEKHKDKVLYLFYKHILAL